MNNDIFFEKLKEIENINDLKSEDIPSLDLYMDQILTLFDEHLVDSKRNENDKLLTKTMINNYSKEGLLNSIKGKKYSKAHILQMLLIYSLKNTISIQETKKVLQPYHDHNEDIEPLYNDFLTVKQSLSHSVTETIEDIITKENIQLQNSNDLTKLLLLVCALSNQYRMIAEKILDTYYLNED